MALWIGKHFLSIKIYFVIGSMIEALFASIKDAAINSNMADDPDVLRDAWWLRWLKYVAIILVPAIIFGVAGFLIGLNARYDTNGSMKFRFWLGAGIGGGLGLIHVVRCIIRKVDP